MSVTMRQKKPIRILIVDGKLISGGVEAFLMNIYRHIDRSKVQFDFLVHYRERFYYDDEIEAMGGKIYRMSFRNDHNYFKYKKDLDRFFKLHTEYKVVWGHMDGLASVYLKSAKKNGVPVTISHSHITSSEKSLKGLVKRLLRLGIPRWSDYRFACSTEAGQYLYGKNKFSLVFNAIDTSSFKYNPEARSRIREQNDWTNNVVVGHVGRFFPQKNHDYLIEIFRNLAMNDSRYVLCLCGDGEDKKRIEEKVYEYNLQDRVLFTGNISNINEYYQAFDIFVLPSLYEGLPVSGIEAETSGLKCFFSDTISREVGVVDNNCCFLSIKEPSEIWVNKIISNSQYDRKDMSGIVASKGYDIYKLSKKLELFFLKLYKG